MCAPTSRKYVSEPAMSILNLKEKLRFYWSHPSVFALGKSLKSVLKNTQKFLTQPAQTIPLFYVHFKTLINVKEDRVFGNSITP